MRSYVASFALLLAACQAPQPTLTSLHGDFVLPPPSHSGAFSEAVTNGDGPNGAHIIFLNYDATTLNVGQDDDASTNTSWIPGSYGKSGTIAYPAFDTSPYTGSMTDTQVKQTIANWMTMFYAPVNVQIVTTRPPSGKRYTMCMVGGTPCDIGVAAYTNGTTCNTSAAGIAPLDCGNQEESNVVYAFAKMLTPSATGSTSESLKGIAVTCAQETAHGFGLGHTTNMMDVMFPYLSNQVTGFGGSSTLQTDGSGQCSNGATSQNSLQMLIDVCGASTGMTQTTTPTVAFVTPKDGDTVPLSFDIIVTASETGGTIQNVAITSEGQAIATLTAPPYQTSVQAPMDGTYQLTATATDTNGNFNSTSVNITASSSQTTQNECSQPTDCGPGLTCMNNKCVPSSSGNCSTPCPSGQTCQPDGTCAPSSSSGGDGGAGSGGNSPGGVGSTCMNGSDCQSGLCAADGDNHFCTQACDPSSSSSCPNGSSCVSAGGTDHICEPNNLSGSGVGCGSVVGARHDSGMFGLCVAILALGLTQLARRRRRA